MCLRGPSPVVLAQETRTSSVFPRRRSCRSREVPRPPSISKRIRNPADATGDYPGRFEYVAALGTACLSTGNDPTGCGELLAPRFGHTATRLEETGTWLDGSVLITGGADPDGTFPPAELFVPAFAC